MDTQITERVKLMTPLAVVSIFVGGALSVGAAFAVYQAAVMSPASFRCTLPMLQQISGQGSTTALAAAKKQTQQAFQQVATGRTRDRLGALQRAATARRNVVARLALTNPDQALAGLLAPAQEKQVSTAAQDCGLAPTAMTGRLTTYTIDMAGGEKPRADIHVLTLSSGRQIRITGSAKALAGIGSGESVTIQGVRIAADAVLATETTGVPRPPASPQSIGPSIENTLIVLVNFTDTNSILPTQATIQSLAFGTGAKTLAGYYAFNSDGKVLLQGDVRNWTRLNISRSSFSAYCGVNNNDMVFTRVRDATVSAIGLGTVQAYSHLIIIGSFGCDGLGGVSAQGLDPSFTFPMTTAIVDASVATDLHFMAHELGHGYNLFHNALLYCPTSTIDFLHPENCQTLTYDDPYDLMGSDNSMNLNAINREEMGWITSAEEKTLTPADLVGNVAHFTILPMGSTTNGLKVLRIPSKTTPTETGISDYIRIEFRQPVGYDANPSHNTGDVFQGALLHVKRFVAGTPVWGRLLLDPVAPYGTAYPFPNLTLHPGMSFTDPGTGTVISIPAGGLSASGLRVDVTGPIREINAPVAAVIAPAADAAVKGTININGTVTDDSGLMSGQLIASTNGGPDQVIGTYNYSTTRPTAGTFAKTFDTSSYGTTTLARATFKFQSTDVFGNTSTSSGTIVSIDNGAPTVSITSPSCPSTCRLRQQVAIITNAADGGSGIDHVEFFANTPTPVGVGKPLPLPTPGDDGGTSGISVTTQPLFASVKVAPFQTTLDTTAMPNGPVTITAIAYDRAGNAATSIAINGMIDNMVPSVSFIAPSPAANSWQKGQIPVQVAAFDNDQIENVVFAYRPSGYPIDLQFAVAPAYPYQVMFDTTDAMVTVNVTIIATATDLAGNTATVSIPIHADNTLPGVVLTKTGTTTIALNAHVTDNNGVTAVQFYKNSVLLNEQVFPLGIGTGSGTDVAFTWNTSGESSGTYAMTAQAVDFAGNARTSTPVSVTVTRSGGGGGGRTPPPRLNEP